MYNIKVASSDLLGDFTGDDSRGGSLSYSSEELLQGNQGGARIYLSFAGKKKKKTWSNIKRLLLITETDISS